MPMINKTQQEKSLSFEEKRRKEIMIGQCFNLVINKQIDFNLNNEFVIDEIKNKTHKLYKILKELYEEI